MGKKKAEEQGSRGGRFKGVEMEAGDRIENNINKILFLADCFASGEIEMTEQGRDGCYWILHDIALDLRDAITEPITA